MFTNLKPAVIDPKPDTTKPLPIEFAREYDQIAEMTAKRRRAGWQKDYAPQSGCYITPGAIDWVLADPESFAERVRSTEYALAMEGAR